jgi:hypothetical protein
MPPPNSAFTNISACRRGSEYATVWLPKTMCACWMSRSTVLTVGGLAGLQLQPALEICQRELRTRRLLVECRRAQLPFRCPRKLLEDAHRQRREIVIAKAERVVAIDRHLHDAGNELWVW